MGNCGACCGKADTNEIVTEKHAKAKGVQSANEHMTSDVARMK